MERLNEEAEKHKANEERPLSGGKISYLFINVFHFQKMYDFYHTVLGLQVDYYEDGQCAFLSLQDGNGPQIALYAGRKSVLPDTSHWFIAIDVADIKWSVAHLQAKGLQVSEVTEVPYGKAAKLSDPEGNVIELHEPQRLK